MSVLMCSERQLSALAILAKASTGRAGLSDLARSLDAMRGRAIEHEAAVERGDAREAFRFGLERRELSALGELRAENVRACAERYSPTEAAAQTAPEAPIAITAADIEALRPVLMDPVGMLRLARSYEYQASESPGWAQSAARDLCATACTVAAGCLDGYADRPWMI